MARPGETIRLQYSRSDEFLSEPLGSAMQCELRASTDADGRIVSWEGTLSSGPHSTRPNGRAGAGFLESAGLIAKPVARPTPRPLGLPRGGADRNAVPYYEIDSVRLQKRFIADTPTRVSALRALGAYANIFSVDGLVDEIAAAHDIDPIDYRLMHLSDTRARDVLERLRERCRERWGGSATYGVGFGRYKNSAAYCAVAVTVDVDDNRGSIAVDSAIAVVDAGLVVNPDGVENQVEGGLIQSVSWTLKERMQVDARRRSALDWASYPILTFSEVPDVVVDIIDRPGEASLGVGEASQGPTAAAVGNAIARTTGVRMRNLPIRYEDLNAAVAAQTE
jgi:CO/xanthine dehydrogenase Mo-binding subunit